MRDIRKDALAKFEWRRHGGVPLKGTNISARNQQKHLFLSIPNYV